MAGKAKFDQEAAFKSIVGRGQGQVEDAEGRAATDTKKSKNRVQRSYFIDRDLDKALRRMALESEMNLTESINEVLRKGLIDFL